MRLWDTWQLRCTLRPHTRSHTSWGAAGSGRSSGRSCSPETWQRVPSRLGKGRESCSPGFSATAAPSSLKSVKTVSRIAATISVAACQTSFPALGLSRGDLARAGITADP